MDRKMKGKCGEREGGIERRRQKRQTRGKKTER